MGDHYVLILLQLIDGIMYATNYIALAYLVINDEWFYSLNCRLQVILVLIAEEGKVQFGAFP